jgi:hypothetical protein
MKIVLLSQTGNMPIGEIVDAAVCRSRTQAYVFDANNVGYYLIENQFDIVEEDNRTSAFVSIRDIVGQDLKQFTVEFK